MEEDPLPAPAVGYKDCFNIRQQRKIKKSVAIILCLFLAVALVLCPQVAFEQTQNECWILKFNSSINQAPRAVIFGALAVLPHKVEIDRVRLSQVWEISRGTLGDPIGKSKNWIVMVWYGSTYV